MDMRKLLDRILPLAGGHRLQQSEPPAASAGLQGALPFIVNLARDASKDTDGNAWFVDSVSDRTGEASRSSEEAQARVLLQAVISAVKVDGHGSNADEGRIMTELDSLGLSDDETSFLRQEWSRPPMLDHLAQGLTTRAETVEVYTASLLAIDTKHPAARNYLDMLAARLGLERALVKQIERTVAAQR